MFESSCRLWWAHYYSGCFYKEPATRPPETHIRTPKLNLTSDTTGRASTQKIILKENKLKHYAETLNSKPCPVTPVYFESWPCFQGPWCVKHVANHDHYKSRSHQRSWTACLESLGPNSAPLKTPKCRWLKSGASEYVYVYTCKQRLQTEPYTGTQDKVAPIFRTANCTLNPEP